MKNCGSPIHEEVASKAFMDELREMVHKTTNDKVRAKILELTQTWAFAFRNTPKYSIIPVNFDLHCRYNLLTLKIPFEIFFP